MILSQPFPTNQDISRIIRFTFFAGCIVFLILVLFQPFGFHKTPSQYFFRNAFFFGLATFIVATANAILLPVLFPRFFEERAWTVTRELGMMLWQVLTISFINLLFLKWLYNEEISGKTIIEVLGITAAVGIFPITLIILLKQYALLKKYGTSAAQLDQQIQYNDAKKIGKASPLITVYGESQRESVSFPLDDFRFISAADNYIKLHFIKDNKLANEVLRNSLKKLSEQFLQYEQVFRCHRTYIVNLSAVNQVTGNAQGYKLHLKGVDEIGTRFTKPQQGAHYSFENGYEELQLTLPRLLFIPPFAIHPKSVPTAPFIWNAVSQSGIFVFSKFTNKKQMPWQLH